MNRLLRTSVLLLVGLALSTPALAAVELSVRLSRTQLSVGETTTLDVVIRGASGGVGQPTFEVPPGVEILGTSRAQNFSWVNGRSTSETVFRYEIGPAVAGEHKIGPIEVRVGGKTYRGGFKTFRVSAAPQRVEGSGDGDTPASLTVTVEPRRPFVGEPVIMQVRLIQRAQLAEDPRYTPPPTPGFWSEDASRPESFYADQNRQRVLVTETRTRMYPIAVGEATVGSAVAMLALAGRGGIDPLQLLRGRIPRREVTLRSDPVRVDVRSLPEGAPAAFDGAVGRLQTSWTPDRRETRLDVPITVRLDVRGVGNLPLIQAPELSSDGFEIFASTVEDSFPAAGTLRPGRRRFLWTALPRREGDVQISVPTFVWFDTERERYTLSAADPIHVEVGPPLIASAGGSGAFPDVFRDQALDPFARSAMPWAWAIAGFALGSGLLLWRRGRQQPTDSAERARQREWLRVVGVASGTEFWRSAQEAMAWAESRGRDVQHLRREISAARYGGSQQNLESVRRRVVEHVSLAVPSAIPRWPLQVTGSALILAAPLLCFLSGPSGGSEAGILRARGADDAARAGDLGQAGREWRALWDEGGRSPRLAARLAWVEVREGGIAPAAVWTLKGEALGGRDPSLTWVRERVHEAGGLTGAGSGRLPLNGLELSIVAMILAAASVAAWPRREWAMGLAVVALTAALIVPIEGVWHGRVSRGVVRDSAILEGPNLRLEPGQVVRILERTEDRTRVAAGRGVEGWLETGLVQDVEAS